MGPPPLGTTTPLAQALAAEERKGDISLGLPSFPLLGSMSKAKETWREAGSPALAHTPVLLAAPLPLAQ